MDRFTFSFLATRFRFKAFEEADEEGTCIRMFTFDATEYASEAFGVEGEVRVITAAYAETGDRTISVIWLTVAGEERAVALEYEDEWEYTAAWHWFASDSDQWISHAIGAPA